MVNLYIGHDQREAVGTHVFIESLLRTSTVPVTIMALHKPMLRRIFGGDVQEGTNAFTVSRFLIPYLQNWRGMAIFMDGADMMLREDIGELVKLYDPYCALQVVKHEYKSRHPRKYVGTSMEAANEAYSRKNWASVMLMNCSHYAWRQMTPEYVRSIGKLELLTFSWVVDSLIGSLPIEWNWLADEYGENANAKLLHWTAGVPLFPHYKDAPNSNEYRRMHERVNYATN